MNPSYPIWSSGNTDTMIPQIYQWAAADRAEEANNIARRTAWDQQAIQNAQNYFNIARQQEAQDVERQQEAERQSYARRLAAEQQARGDYQFGQSLKFNQDQLAANKQLKSDILTQKQEEAKAGALASLIDSVSKGEYFDSTPEELAKMFGTSVEEVKKNVFPIRERYAAKALDELNVQVANMRASKDPKKWATGEFGDAVEGMKVKLPVGLRGKVRLNRNTWQFEFAGTNPVASSRIPSAAQEAVALSSQNAGDNTGYFPWMAREEKRAEALANYEAELNARKPQYQFSTTQTATTPAPALVPAPQQAPANYSFAPTQQPAPPAEPTQPPVEPPAVNPVAPPPVEIKKPSNLVTAADVKRAMEKLNALRNSSEERMRTSGDRLPLKTEIKAIDDALLEYEKILNKYKKDGMVPVLDPNNKPGYVPRSKLAGAIARGYTVVK